MPRVSTETMGKLIDFIGSLPDETKAKCALCNDTLLHIVKTAEVQCEAGTATVTKVLAAHINDGAAPGDQVSGNQLRNKVQYNEGKVKCGNSANNPKSPKIMNKSKRKRSQKAIWESVEKKLTGLADFMMENCEVPPNITESIQLRILNNINIIRIFENEVLKWGG